MAGQMQIRRSLRYLLQKNVQQLDRLYASSSAKSTKTSGQKKSAEAVGKSLAAKGFLRPQKPYLAGTGVADKVRAICSAIQLSKASDHQFTDLGEKFKFLDACFKDFKHSVPNSQVHELQTVGDVIKFYEESVDTTVPYDALKKMELPENLHIQYDYVRFHPETDTKFNGQTAFPKSSTLVTGLKYRGKYQGHEAKRSWP